MRLSIILLAFAFIFHSCGQGSSSPTDQLTAKEITPEGLAWYSIDDLDKMTDLGDKKVLVDKRLEIEERITNDAVTSRLYLQEKSSAYLPF